jgi:hypothetical protein
MADPVIRLPALVLYGLVVVLLGLGAGAEGLGAQRQAPGPGDASPDEFAFVPTDHFCIYTTTGEQDARRMADLAEAVHDEFTYLIREPSGTHLFGDRKADLYILADRAEYTFVVDTVMLWYRREEAVLDFYRHSERVINTEPPVAITVKDHHPLPNFIVNATAHLLLSHFVGRHKRLPAWLAEGFAAHLEHRWTGSCANYRVTIQRYGDGDVDPVAAKRGGCTGWADIMETRVRTGRYRTFDRLKHLTLNHLTYHDLCRSWSLATFLVEEHPRKFVRWLRALRHRSRLDPGSAWERPFFRVFGWTGEALDRRWTDWVRLTGKLRRMR